MKTFDGTITNFQPEGITVFVPIHDWSKIPRNLKDVCVGISDGKTITIDQRKKIYACMRDIADFMGETEESTKALLKLEFTHSRLESLQKEIFSLSDCDVSTAREFIGYLIDFMVDHNIPSKKPLYALSEDIDRYVYTCLTKKQCAVCGRSGADMHHVEAIGMGADRDTTYQIGMEVISLCREHHNKVHSQGKSWLERLHLHGIPLTYDIGRVYNYSKKSLGG